MSIVAGVDFGTLSVRVTLADTGRGSLGTAIAEYPLGRLRSDPDLATQSHFDHMDALARAMRLALADCGIESSQVRAIAVDTTGSSVIPVDRNLNPLSDYYLWCDHRAKAEAEEITAMAHETQLEAIEWCGGTYSHEWGFAKLLHWLRHNPGLRERFGTALEHCDMAAAVLTGVDDSTSLVRSVCAMGHKWMWNPKWGGLPSQAFLSRVDPLFDGIREKIGGSYHTSAKVAGRLCHLWADKLGLTAGIPVPVGAFDAHWDAIGAGCKLGDVVNVIGTSTCIIAVSERVKLIPGVCGVVPGSAHPDLVGVEAGLSATGDIFDAIAKRASTSVSKLSEGLEGIEGGKTGLMRFAWDNGDRTVLVRSDLGGMTIGWHLGHTSQDELYAAIEGTAFHTRIILERMEEHGVPVHRVINGGGVPQKNPLLNQIYANVLGKPILVPDGLPTGLGSSIFASLASRDHSSIEAAQAQMCVGLKRYDPNPSTRERYEMLYQLYKQVYMGFGTSSRSNFSQVLGDIKRIAAGEEVRSEIGQRPLRKVAAV
ncbi:ribulokinase [Mesorhizobium sp.]|uniref:ribulokinase n=1 Tax=Mesorhizobium sp. TaxID=1871066 RepID=UPI000FE9DD1E|nr:ribulokinase [Mesorhizobium sp.]RWG04169.1 MAG: ribulokinase [Mesorhizobium sp.]RWH01166.1 MAG: ribulokinase [Mesorhizobium sp.]RWI16618.1 MAG: ribulokinase [Mesorhizobium sp.]RWN07686.1 MAG: ribulokinase [Mesorhizobium sp.]RWN12396.1 MAG: ribulokinase [Mesorhizobium sp.]